MTKKVKPGESQDQSNGNEYRATEITNANSGSPPAQAVNLPNVQIHHSNQTEEGRQALLLINKYFLQRKASTLDYLTQFIIVSGQTSANFDAYMYANEYDNLFFRKTVEEAYYDGLRWKHKEAGFIRVWRINGAENYVSAANFNMVGKFRRKKHSSADLVPYEVRTEAISQLKKLLLVSQ